MMLDVDQALLWTERLLAFALLIQSVEHLRLSISTSFQSIWSFENLKNELEQNLPLPKPLIHLLFSISGFRLISLSLFGLAFYSFFHSSFYVYLFMSLIHLLINIRFRGNFNGGSDTMTFVVITGLCIAHFSDTEALQKWGLIYIGIHGLYSYFKAGLVKVRHSEWRNGKAILQFLDYGVVQPKTSWMHFVKSSPQLQILLSWLTLGFELAIISLFFYPEWILFYGISAALFHLSIFFLFGLNRFFWIWLSAWPGIWILVKSLNSSF